MLHGAIFFATTAAMALQFAREVAGKLQRVTCPLCNLSRNFLGLQLLHKVELGSTFCDNRQFTQKMADQRWFDFYVVFTMSLCAL